MSRSLFHSTLSYRPERLFMLSFLLAAMMSVTGAGQNTTSSYDGKTPSGLAPGAPAGSYPLSGFDNINLYNGRLNFHLPLLQMGGRGAAGYVSLLTIEKHWNVKSQVVSQSCYPTTPLICNYIYSYWPSDTEWNGVPVGQSAGTLVGRQTGVQTYVGCSSTPGTWTQTITRLTFTAPDGTEFELRDKLHNGSDLNSGAYVCNPGSGPDRGQVWTTVDGSAATFISDTSIRDTNGYADKSFSNQQTLFIYPSGYLFLRDGTRYRIDNGAIAWVRDRNGNKVSRASGIVTDSLNRQFDYSAGNVITWRGAGGQTRSITLETDYNINYLRADYRPGGAHYVAGGDLGNGYKTHAWLFPSLNGATSSYGPFLQSPTSVLLPDGRRYRFYYNPYKELARVELPTGGAIEYDWDGFGAVQANGFKESVAFTGSGPVGIYRRVVERRVYADGVTLTEKTRYEETLVDGNEIVTVDHLTPSGTLLGRSKHYFYSHPLLSLTSTNPYNAISYEDPLNGREYRTEAYASNGTTLLRTVENTWQPRASYPNQYGTPNSLAVDLRVTETKNTLADTNQVSRQTFSYSPDEYNNQTDVYEYDYGAGAAGALVRRTHTDYLTSGYDTIAGGISNPDPNATIHLRSLPTQTQVFDAGGVLRAQTALEYDNYSSSGNNAPLTARGSISGHDSATYSTSYTTRGNPTKTTSYLLNSSGGVTGSISAYPQYDIAGNVVKTIDGRGNVTTFDFNDRFGSPDGDARNNAGASELAGLYTFAFPTKVTNALGHEAYIQFDYYLGKPVDTEDANNIKASLYYNDALDRPTQARDHVTSSTTYYRQKTINYDDTNKVITITSDKDTVNDNVLTDKAYYDGLGRTYRTASYEGNTGSGNTWAIVETQFDALGRAYRACNPFRASVPNAALPGSPEWTTTTFDALSRATMVTTPDGAHVDTSYSGNQVTVTDQAGKNRKSETDALGRLKQVQENPTGLNYLTSYQYDVLGNLKTVTQGSQTRTFNYDSLSRLTAATNPESGTVSYQYDGNSNLTSKTDARGVTTTYGYDALNRNTSLTHLPVTNGTTDVYFWYDTATNGKGRFGYSVSYNARWYGDGRPYWHADVTTGYDALGRPTGKWQGFIGFDGAGNATAWQPYNLSRTYNLAGGVTSETYPSGRTVSYSYDTAGRLQNFSGTLGDGVSRGYATGITYNSAGLMSRETYGTQTPLSLNLHYNNRQQMVDLRLGTNSGDEWDWSRGALIFYYGTAARTAWNPFANSSDNNGNVLRQVSYAPLPAGGYVIPQLDDYTYDTLNRVTAVSEIQQSSSGVWSGNVFTQTFSYDRWGNRGIDVASTTANVPGVTRKNLTFNAANNRLTAIDGVAVAYDSAGNQTTISASGQPDYELRDYDAGNRMTRATKSGVTSYYHYDGSGKRVRRVIGGAETWQVYGFEGELVAEYNVSGTFNGSNAPAATSPAKEYGYRSGKLLVVWDASQSGNAAFRWLVTDHLGSTRMEADLSGSLTTLKRHDYLPFGEELVATTGAQRGGIGYEPPASNVRQKFTGHERDGETGLDFMQARYCSSVQGRFISPDEVFADQSEDEPQSWNLYTYVANNPLKYSDPFGLWKKFVDGSNIYYIAEKGDTLTSLAGEIGTSPDRVVNFFDGNDKVPIGVYYDVTALVTQLERERKQIQNLMQYLERRSGDLIERRIQGDSVDPRSPWKMHWPGIDGSRPRNNAPGSNIFSQGNGSTGGSIKETFDSIWKSGKVPAGWRPLKGGTTKVRINNKELLEELRRKLPGEWKKVYRRGADGTEIHYFEHESGKVFNVKHIEK